MLICCTSLPCPRQIEPVYKMYFAKKVISPTIKKKPNCFRGPHSSKYLSLVKIQQNFWVMKTEKIISKFLIVVMKHTGSLLTHSLETGM